MADLFFLTPRGDRLHSTSARLAEKAAQVKEAGGKEEGERARERESAMRNIKALRWSVRSKSATAVNHRRPWKSRAQLR